MDRKPRWNVAGELEKYKVKPEWTVNAEDVIFLGKK